MNDPASITRALPDVSCAPFRLYGDSPPITIPSGIRPQDYGIRIVAELFAGCRYRWQFPADGFVTAGHFTDCLAQFYAGIAEKRCPPSLLAEIANATLFEAVIRCSSTNGDALLYETYRLSDHAAANLPSASQLAQADRQRFAGRDWQNLYVGSVGSPNYGHWLIDDLPRLKAAMHLLVNDSRPVRILLHEFYQPIDRVRLEMIHFLFGNKVRVEWLDFSQAYHFEEVYYATPVSDHPVLKSPLALDFAVRHLVDLAMSDPNSDGRGDRIYVTRDPRRGRRLVNQDKVCDLVRSRGFNIVDPETMGPIEQIRLFAGAHTVIGQMGAAMTNTVFSPPTTTTIYLAPTGWIEPFYWDLAAVRGHRYRVLYGDVADATIPPHESAFTIELDQLANTIDSL